MNSEGPQSWTNAMSKAAWTLLLVAVAVFIAWQLLKQLVVPLLVLVGLFAIYRIVFGGTRRNGW
jgi:hypothetical protein